MKKTAFLLTVAGAPVFAHPGAHVHPHDGLSWLAVVTGLAVMVIAGGLARKVARVRR